MDIIDIFMTFIIVVLVMTLCSCYDIYSVKDIGYFVNNNPIAIDYSGLRSGYGISEFYSGITGDGQSSYIYDNGNNGSDSEDYGNFIAEPLEYKQTPFKLNQIKSVVDPLSLEDVMNSSDVGKNCLINKCSGKMVGQTCEYDLINPDYGYRRTIAGTNLLYNDNLADPLFKSVQYSNGVIKVPFSDLYNNKSPSNPTIR